MDKELIDLLLSIEDKRFWRHRGVDVKAMVRALVGVACNRPWGGGSTIDMQLVRTITGRREQSLSRKAKEALSAVIIRRRLGRFAVIKLYLRLAYFGEGITGAEACSHTLFGKPIEACSLEQKAIIVAALRYPVPSHMADEWSKRVNKRAARALALYASRAVEDQPSDRFSPGTS